MYVNTPCNEPNSASPISADRIAAQNALLDYFNGQMDQGNATLDDLIRNLYGNVGGSLDPGSAGVPTGFLPGGGASGGSGGSGAVAGSGGPVGGRRPRWIPRPGLNRLFPRYGPESGFPNLGQNRSCRLPLVVPYVPGAPTPRPPSPQPRVAPPPVLGAPPACDDCSFDASSICYALRDGCVLSSQVSPEQLFACSQAGYAGNLNLYPNVVKCGGAQKGKFFGTVNLSPAAFDGGSLADRRRGMAGVTDRIGMLPPSYVPVDYFPFTPGQGNVSPQMLLNSPAAAPIVTMQQVQPASGASSSTLAVAAAAAAVVAGLFFFGGKR